MIRSGRPSLEITPLLTLGRTESIKNQSLKLTVCSAGIWRRCWPWRCCPLARCGRCSLCPRGRVRRERSLWTEERGALCSETGERRMKGEVRVPALPQRAFRGLTSLLKKGGQRMYVDLGSHGKTTESGLSMLFQNVFPFWKRAEHLSTFTHIKKRTFLCISIKKTALVSSPNLHPSPEILEDRGDDRVLLRLLDLLSGRPDITKIHLLSA